MQTELTSRYVRDVVLSAFAEIVGGQPPHGLDTAPEHLADWSSLAQIRLLHAVEQDLGCMLDERFLTVGSTLAELVDAACAAVGATADS
jgi:hypothetical protein